MFKQMWQIRKCELIWVHTLFCFHLLWVFIPLPLFQHAVSLLVPACIALGLKACEVTLSSCSYGPIIVDFLSAGITAQTEAILPFKSCSECSRINTSYVG